MIANRELVMMTFRTNVFNLPDKHAAGPGHGIMHLASGSDDVENLSSNRSAIPTMLIGQLPEAGGVEIQTMNPDAHLTLVQWRRGIQPPGGLGQHTFGFDDSMQTDGAHRVTHRLTFHVES